MSGNIETEFCEVMRFGRKRKKINQTELGKIVGVNQHTISYYELGTISPKLECAVKILDELGYEFTIRRKPEISLPST